MSTEQKKQGFQSKQLVIWLVAMIIGAGFGILNVKWIIDLGNFIATVYTKLFQFVAVPTIALAICTTLISLGGKKDTGKIFLHTIFYTILTTFVSAFVALVLFKIVQPGNLPTDLNTQEVEAAVGVTAGDISYYSHILSIIPNNIINPFLSGNVLGVLIVAAATGLSLAFMKPTENRDALIKVIFGAQELLFAFIRALIKVLPLGIVAFTMQLSAQVSTGIAMGVLGKYATVIIGGNLVQFFIVLPIFMVIRGINPLKVFRAMSPALLMALFTKSSAATLPVSVASAENNMKVKPEVARFILPICCTVNMNGCAAFILATSLFVLQNGNMAPVGIGALLLWVCISVFSAVGNAGVPMGCYFLTLSLMSGSNAPVWIMGVILPIYALIDMLETAENVWSDYCITAVVNRELYPGYASDLDLRKAK